MQKRVFYFIIFSTLALALFINIFLIFSIESVLKNELFDRLKNYAYSIKSEVLSSIQNGSIQSLKDLDETYRISIIDQNGVVIYDNLVNNLNLDNHSNRAEFKEAIEDGESTNIRYSNTLLKRNLYYGLKISNEKGEFVLRISKEQD